MTQLGDDRFERQLQSYLDGQMTSDEAADFRRRIRSSPEVAQAEQLQRGLDDALRRLFEPAEWSDARWRRTLELAEDQAAQVATRPRPESRKRRFALIATAAAAVAVWVLVAWQFRDPGVPEPFFAPRPLADLYREAVRTGFRPYYDCRDNERFADTFRQRQRQPLELADLPDDRRMLGLSYLGGLSRDTTAILCRVQGRPVVVFVDRQREDQPIATAGLQGLNVFRRELRGLIMYEVTPLEEARILDYLHLAGSP